MLQGLNNSALAILHSRPCASIARCEHVLQGLSNANLLQPGHSALQAPRLHGQVGCAQQYSLGWQLPLQKAGGTLPWASRAAGQSCHLRPEADMLQRPAQMDVAALLPTQQDPSVPVWPHRQLPRSRGGLQDSLGLRCRRAWCQGAVWGRQAAQRQTSAKECLQAPPADQRTEAAQVHSLNGLPCSPRLCLLAALTGAGEPH